MKKFLRTLVALILVIAEVSVIFGFLPAFFFLQAAETPLFLDRMAAEYCESIGFDDGYYEMCDGTYNCGGGNIFFPYNPRD